MRVLLLVLALLAGPAVSAQSLLISEYVEGSSFNKAVEILNVTGAPYDLGANGVTLEIYFNGSTTATTTIALTGTVQPGDVFVVADNDAAFANLADQVSTATFFNGDDAVVLRAGATVFDAIGQVGVDPGTEWGTGAVSTQDNTIRRQDAACAGDTDTSDAFDPADDYDGFAQDTFDGLGTYTGTCGAGPVSAARRLLISEAVVTPTAGEYVEILNPTSAAVDLSDVYLTDATFAGGGAYYYNVVTGQNAGGGGFGDFHARFPDGASIAPGQVVTVALNGSASFATTYGQAPDYELYDDGSSADGVPSMREALPGSVNGQGGLTNDGEVVVLYYWDGETDLVTDLDYVVWGDKAEAVDKSGVSVDGPDADDVASTYADEVSVPNQAVVAPGSHSTGASFSRLDLDEGTEADTGGNGVGGEDETSENLNETFSAELPVSPGVGPGAGGAAGLVVNEVDYDQVGTDNAEYVELYNAGPVALDLGLYDLVLVNGDGGAIYKTVELPSVSLAAGAFFVVCGDAATVDGCDLDVSPDANLVQNGPDAVAVTLRADGSVVDALSYEGAVAGYVEGDAATAADTNSDPFLALSRRPDGADTDDNDADFSLRCATPGAANSDETAGCEPPGPTLISAVQGAGPASPIEGAEVTVEAVVVGDFQDAVGADGDLNGFFVQEEDADADGDPATSEGVFVFQGSAPAVDVAQGDRVRVTGTVTEFNGVTQLSNVTVTVLGTAALPTAASVTLPVPSLDAFEAVEGMRVVMPQALTISESFNFDRFGEIVIGRPPDGLDRIQQYTAYYGTDAAGFQAYQDLVERSTVTLDDGLTAQNPPVLRHPNGAPFSSDNRFRNGDTVTGTEGVLTFSFGLWRVQPTAPATVTPANPRPSDPGDLGGTLRVGGLNVLNYFNTVDAGPAVCGPTASQDCRGADSAAELARQTTKLVEAVAFLDASILGLVEIENDPAGEDSSLDDLVDAINADQGAGTYAYVETGAVGTDAIRVALIYRPADVALVGGFAILDSSVDPRFDDGRNRPSLAQTFRERATGGVFTAVINHLKSKGSGCGAGDDDPVQGSCNGTRTAAAEALVDWLAGDPTGSGDPDVLILGDLNAYDLEDPISAIAEGADDADGTADDYVDLVERDNGEAAYSYVFDAGVGYLDYALASTALAGQVTGSAPVHLSADEPDVLDYNLDFGRDPAYFEPNAFRASDHDPILVGLALAAPVATVTTSASSVTEGTAFTVTVALSQPLAADGSLTLTVAGDGDSADLGGFASQTVAVPAGATGVTFVVTPPEDGQAEGPETFTFTLSDPDGLTIGDPSQASVTVTDVSTGPDPDATTVSFGAVQQSVSEGAGSVELAVTISGLPDETTTVVVTLVSGDPADLGGFTSERLTFSSELGAPSTLTVTVPITDDARPEPAESFTFRLTVEDVDGDGEAVVVGDPGQTVLVVVDNDGQAVTVTVPAVGGPLVLAVPVNGVTAGELAQAAGADSVFVLDGTRFVVAAPDAVLSAGQAVLVDAQRDLDLSGSAPADVVTFGSATVAGTEGETRVLVAVGNPTGAPLALDAVDVTGGTLADVALVFDSASGAFRPVSLAGLDGDEGSAVLGPFEVVVLQVIPDGVAADVSVSVPTDGPEADGPSVSEAPFVATDGETAVVVALRPASSGTERTAEAPAPGDTFVLRLGAGADGLDPFDGFDVASPLGGTLAARRSGVGTPFAALALGPLTRAEAVTVPLAVSVPASGAYEFALVAAPDPVDGRPVVVEVLDGTSATVLAVGEPVRFDADAAGPVVSDRFALRVSIGLSVGTTDGPGGASLSVYPNPSAGATTVSVRAASGTRVRVAVYDVLGREVAVLHEGPSTGDVGAALDAGRLPAGTYVVRAAVGGAVFVQPFTVVR